MDSSASLPQVLRPGSSSSSMLGSDSPQLSALIKGKVNVNDNNNNNNNNYSNQSSSASEKINNVHPDLHSATKLMSELSADPHTTNSFSCLNSPSNNSQGLTVKDTGRLQQATEGRAFWMRSATLCSCPSGTTVLFQLLQLQWSAKGMWVRSLHGTIFPFLMGSERERETVQLTIMRTSDMQHLKGLRTHFESPYYPTKNYQLFKCFLITINPPTSIP